MNTTNYQQQAIEFLNATGTTFTASFKEYDFYFLDDKDCRDIFTCTTKKWQA
jgi:hypothetical protein